MCTALGDDIAARALAKRAAYIDPTYSLARAGRQVKALEPVAADTRTACPQIDVRGETSWLRLAQTLHELATSPSQNADGTQSSFRGRLRIVMHASHSTPLSAPADDVAAIAGIRGTQPPVCLPGSKTTTEAVPNSGTAQNSHAAVASEGANSSCQPVSNALAAGLNGRTNSLEGPEYVGGDTKSAQTEPSLLKDAVCQAGGRDTVANHRRYGANAPEIAARSSPRNNTRKSERNTINERRRAAEDKQPRTLIVAGGAESQPQSAAAQLSIFLDPAYDSTNSVSLPSPAKSVSEQPLATEPSSDSCRAFICRKNDSSDSTLLSIIRDVVTTLCIDPQCRLPAGVAAEVLQLHTVLQRHSALPICRQCILFLAELHFDAYRTMVGSTPVSDMHTRQLHLQSCEELIHRLNVGHLNNGFAHLSRVNRARLYWLRGLIADERSDPDAARSFYAACSEQLRVGGGCSAILIASVQRDQLISVATLLEKQTSLEENVHTLKLTSLFTEQKYAEFVADVLPRLDKKETQSKAPQWCRLLNWLLKASHRTNNWEAVIRCHCSRLKFLQTRKCDTQWRSGCSIMCGVSREYLMERASALAQELRVPACRANKKLIDAAETILRMKPCDVTDTIYEAVSELRFQAHKWIDAMDAKKVGVASNLDALNHAAQLAKCVLPLVNSGEDCSTENGEVHMLTMRHEIQTLLRSVRMVESVPSASGPTLHRLMHLVIPCIDVLTQWADEKDGTAKVASTYVLGVWECFIRLWTLANQPHLKTAECEVNHCEQVSNVADGALGPQRRALSNLAKVALKSCRLVEGERYHGYSHTLVKLLAQLLLSSRFVSNDNPLQCGDLDNSKDTDEDRLLEWCLFDLHGVAFPEHEKTKMRQGTKDKTETAAVQMDPKDAFLWYCFAKQRHLLNDDDVWAAPKRLRFVQMIFSAMCAQHPAPVNDAVTSYVRATVQGDKDQASVDHDGSALTSGIYRIYNELYFKLADTKHNNMNCEFFEDKNITQILRRSPAWRNKWTREHQHLGNLYLHDLFINPNHHDSWLSLGQCYLRILDNLLDTLVIARDDERSAANDVAPRDFDELLAGTAVDFFHRARNCFVHATVLAPDRHEAWDQLGFLTFLQIRHGQRHPDTIADAIKFFAQAKQREAKEWMYPFMIGKLKELQGHPPTVWMPEYLECMRLHRESSIDFDNVELVYRIHASRIKAVTGRTSSSLPHADTASWKLLLASASCTQTGADLEDVCLPESLESRRQAVIDSAIAELQLLSKRKKPAGMQWFYKGSYTVSLAKIKLGDFRGAMEELRHKQTGLFDLEMPRTSDKGKMRSWIYQKNNKHHIWKMHTYKYTDFGDFAFVTERKYDQWRMKCLYLYMLVLASVDDPDCELLKLNESIAMDGGRPRGQDRRILNHRWSEEGRCCALAARYLVVMRKFENTANRPALVAATTDCSHSASTEMSVKGKVPVAASRDREDSTTAQASAACNQPSGSPVAQPLLLDVYNLFCSVVTWQFPNGDRSQPSRYAGMVSCEVDAGDTAFSRIDIADTPAVGPNLHSKRLFLDYMHRHRVNVDQFSFLHVVALLRRAFGRFADSVEAGRKLEGTPRAYIIQYCERLLRGENVSVRDHLAQCEEAAAAAKAAAATAAVLKAQANNKKRRKINHAARVRTQPPTLPEQPRAADVAADTISAVASAAVAKSPNVKLGSSHTRNQPDSDSQRQHRLPGPAALSAVAVDPPVADLDCEQTAPLYLQKRKATGCLRSPSRGNKRAT